MTADRTSLEGLRVFIVEDEFPVLLLLEDMLAELGCEIAGTASRLAVAVAMADEIACDIAVLDVNVAGENIAPVAERLAARGLPLVFSTGYGRSGMDTRWRDYPVLQKPYRIEDLAKAIAGARERGAG